MGSAVMSWNLCHRRTDVIDVLRLWFEVHIYNGCGIFAPTVEPMVSSSCTYTRKLEPTQASTYT